MWSLTLLTTALAAGLDADGAGLPTHDGSLRSPTLLSRAPTLAGGGVAVGLRGALEVSPLVRTAPGLGETAVIGSAASARLQGSVGVLDALALAADVPVRLAATSDIDAGGPSPGDASVTAWWHRRTVGAEIGVGATAQLPTGSRARYAGSGRLVPGLTLTGSTGRSWIVSTAIGATHEGAVDPPGAVGGPVLAGGIALDRAAGRWAAGVALRGNAPLDTEVRARRGTALEAGVHAAFDPDGAERPLLVDVLASRALLDAAGTPAWRVSAAVVASFGPRSQRPEPVPVVRQIEVLDPEGRPVAGAGAVFPDGVAISADASGVLTWEGDAVPVVSAPGLSAREAPREGSIQLDWAPVPLQVTIATENGESVEPVVSIAATDLPGAEITRGETMWTAALMPGTWELAVSAEGFGAQTREILVVPGRYAPIELEVVLLPTRGAARLDVTVTDPQGRGVLGAEVRVDGVSIGTAAQGNVGIDGLEETIHAVDIDARYFEEEGREVDLTSGAGAADIGLYYAPGTVRVTARGPDGPIRDGTVFFQGPRALPPLKLGDFGERLVQLSNGRWACVLTSPAYGIQERSLLVEPDGPVPLNAEFNLAPAAKGTADLIVALADPDGQPLEDVEIRLNGVSVGRTGTGGQLRLFELQTGPIAISTLGPGLVDARRDLALRDGLQEAGIGLTWEQGAVRVSARTPDGPANAFVEFDGPAPYEGAALGDPGRRLFEGVPQGEWEIVASHEAGLEVAWTVVADDGGRLNDVSIAIGDETGQAGLEVTVRAPGGNPVDDAIILLDGRRLASTASGGRLRVSGLVAGTRTLEVRHPAFDPWRREVTLLDGGTIAAAAALQWKPGVLDLRISSGGAPARDTEVYVAGDRPHPPIAPGPDGRSLVALGPGEWDVLVSSPSAGLAERTVILPADGPPTVLEIELQTTGELVTRVRDRRGEPVPDATIRVNGAEAGFTDATGIARLTLPVQGAEVSVSHPHMEPIPSVRVPGDATNQLFEGQWKRQDVPVRVRYDDRAIRAEVGAMGPGRIEPVTIEGSGTLALPPGRWQILVSADDLAVARKTVDVIAGVPQTAPVSFDLADAQIRVTAEGIELKNVRFDLDRDVALDRYATVLEEVAATVIADSRILKLEVQGHTDAQGSPVYNYDLSRRRAQSVVQALIELGVPPNLLEARGFGPSRPVADNGTPEGRALNRRVDFRTIVAD